MRLLRETLQPLVSGLLLLLLLMGTGQAMAQNAAQKITGTVKNSKGEPVASATVIVKKGTANTTTDEQGNFSISTAQGQTLVITSINYEAFEIVIGTETNLAISLKDKANALTDVVVVGYGKGSRKTISSAIVSVKPEDLNRAATGDVGQLLQGKVPGLNITASGDPNRAAAVVLRGASTINSPQGPFYVIDGIPGADITTIAPDDIASIDVLKDAAATAIYGNRASNGVIMVTTKKGRSGRLQTTYSGFVGLEKVSGKLDLMDANELKAYVAKNGYTILPTDDLGANTDWMKAVQRPQAYSHNHNISFSGGSEKTVYSASINYLSKDGIMLNSSLKRIIARLSIEQSALNDKVKFGLNVTNSNSKASYTPLQNEVLQQAAKHMPTSPVYNADGSYFENFNTTGYFNPVSLITNADNDTKYNTLMGNFTVEAKLPFGIKYNLNLAYQKSNALHGEYYNSYYSNNYKSGFYSNPDPGGITSSRGLLNFGTNGSAIRNYYENSTVTAESFLTWNKEIKDHSITAVVGYSWQQNNNGDGLQATNTNFTSDYTGYNNLGLGNYMAVNGYAVNFGGTRLETTRFISDFARLNYNYAGKYLLQASIRRDGSSVFGTNNQWGYFPAASLAWRIDQEKFMYKASFISDLKLRVSYGQTGNAFGFGAYTAKQLFTSQGTYYNNGSYTTAIGVSQGANPDLQWEVTATSNIGLDFGLFKNKITGTLDFYEKNTTDMIYGYTVSSTIVPGGFVTGNGGKLRNRGVEFSLAGTPVRGKSFSWNTSVNFAINKNVILDLNGPEKYGVNSDSLLYTQPDGPGQTGNKLQILKVGHPIGQFFTLNYQGKDKDGYSQYLKQDGSLTTAPTYGADYFYLGSPHPNLLLGWNNTLTYKNFDLNFFFRGVFGNKVFNVTRADLSYTPSATTNNLTPSAADDLMKDGKNGNYSSRYIESGSYVRLDNATLNYRVPVKNNYISSLRFYVTGNNIFVITKYSGVDPEINQGGIGLGVDANNFYPKTRTIMVGVNVGF